MFTGPSAFARTLVVGSVALGAALLLNDSAAAQLAPRTTSGAARYFGPPRVTVAPSGARTSYRRPRSSHYLARPRTATIFVHRGRGVPAAVYHQSALRRSPAVRSGRAAPLPRITYPRAIAPPSISAPRVTAPTRVGR